MLFIFHSGGGDFLIYSGTFVVKINKLNKILMKKLFLTLLTCMVAMLTNAQTLSTTAVYSFDKLENGAIYALKTLNNKATSEGWYYNDGNFKFTLSPNDITPGETVSADKNKFLWKVYKNSNNTISLVNMYNGVYFGKATHNTGDNLSSNTGCSEEIGEFNFEVSTKHGDNNYLDLYIQNGSNKYYIAANNGGNLGYWTLGEQDENKACVQFYQVEDPANIQLPIKVGKPYILRLGDGTANNVGDYIYTTDGSNIAALPPNGNAVANQAPNLSTLGSEWFFEGDYAKGFKIINAKSRKVLGVNSETLKTNERTPIGLYDANNPGENISILWDITGSTNLNNGFYLGVQGSIRDRANHNNGNLAFWKTGVGKGSTFRVYENVELPLTQVGDKYYATTYLPFAVTIPEGVNAYTATLNENNITLNAVSGVLPAETAVILEGGAAAASFKLTSDNSTTVNKGNMKGTLSAKTIEAGTTDFLVLGTKDGVLGFYLPKETMTSIAGNRAYFDISSNGAAQKGFGLNFDIVSGINNAVVGNTVQGAIYDLTGRRVNNMVKGGIYICNGKKIIIK